MRRWYIGRVRELFRHLELVLLDDGEIVAAGWAVPLRWNGQIDDLPAGYNDSLARAVDGHDAGEAPTPSPFLLPRSVMTFKARALPVNY